MVRRVTLRATVARPGRDGCDPMLSLGQAARLANTSKTTLTRAIKAGRLSATRRDGGGYSIDPSELARVFTVTPETPVTSDGDGDVVHHETHERDPGATPATVTLDAETVMRLAAAEAEVAGLRALLAEVRERMDETRADRDQLRADRDGWRERAERLLAGPPSRPWWRRLVS